MPLALALGVLGVTVLYLLANIAYLCVLPFWGDAGSADVMGKGIQHATQDRVGTAGEREWDAARERDGERGWGDGA